LRFSFVPKDDDHDDEEDGADKNRNKEEERRTIAERSVSDHLAVRGVGV
jgi:hypothetical protein